MNPELAKARQHYETLPPHVQDRKTAQHLLKAIHMVEGLAGAIETYLVNRQLTPLAVEDLKAALARVSKPEGE